MIIHKDIQLHLNKLLSLKANGTEQDWDIECADESRLQEFINFFNNNDSLTLTQQYSVVCLLIASYDDYLNTAHHLEDKTWNEIVAILNRNKKGYNEILNYWAQWNTNDTYKITPLIRLYLTNLSIS